MCEGRAITVRPSSCAESLEYSDGPSAPDCQVEWSRGLRGPLCGMGDKPQVMDAPKQRFSPIGSYGWRDVLLAQLVRWPQIALRMGRPTRVVASELWRASLAAGICQRRGAAARMDRRCPDLDSLFARSSP